MSRAHRRQPKSSRAIVWLRKIVGFIAVCFALLLLAAKVASYIPPDNLAITIIFHLVFPILWVLNIIFFLIGVVRWRTYARWSFVALLLTSTLMAAHIQLYNSKPKSNQDIEKSISILSFNVRSFKALGANKQQWNRDSVLNYVHRQSPDILCLQEFVSYQTLNTTQDFSQALQLPHVAFYSYKFTKRKSKYEDLIVLFSCYPIVRSQPFYQDDKLYALRADVEINGQICSVYNVHLASNRFGNSEFQLFADANAKNKRSKVKHLLQRLIRSGQSRARQVRTIQYDVENNDMPIVICGDFNDTPASYTYHTLSDDMNDAFREHGAGYGDSYNGPLPPMRIDYILSSGQAFEVIDYQCNRINISDHYPIHAKLKMINN